ncbi:hypothetical protein ECANGB1_400 [Enterospora canceri]|uniref:RRM domain-containing protein n=1 Tax=Enterospora canceri TaxID=1081671 RepID=A0A1Y1S8W4_9MICR|nr:hypothetical protein ECANGB1_400 [Enterospora canceri]
MQMVDDVIRVNSAKLKLITKIDFYENMAEDESSGKSSRKRVVTFSDKVTVHEIPNDNRKVRRIRRGSKSSKSSSNSNNNNNNNNNNISINNIKQYKIDGLNVTVENKWVKNARGYRTMIKEKGNVVLGYGSREQMERDLRRMFKTEKSGGRCVENKFMVMGLKYTENEGSLKEYFGRFGLVEKVVVEKNRKGWCLGKAVVTMMGFDYSKRHRIGGRGVRIERIKH